MVMNEAGFPPDKLQTQNRSERRRKTMSREELIAAVDEEISRLEKVRALLRSDAGPRVAAPSFGNRPRRKRVLSAEARARIAAAQKRRWAKQKAAQAAKK
jgi:hypothetical protein